MKNFILYPLSLFPCKRPLVANARPLVANADLRSTVVANSLGDPIGDGEWFKVSPYGVFAGSEQNPEQHFQKAQADAMTLEFNSLKGRLKTLFRGRPIYVGHPDVDPVLYPDHRRIGKYTELEARKDGLWAKAEWNSLGKENQEQGYHVYPSPVWDAPHGQAQFTPDRLLSVGMTNFPRIQTSEPVTANSSLNLPTNKPNQIEPMLREALIKKYNLAPEATDEEIEAAVMADMSAEEKPPATPPAKVEEPKPAEDSEESEETKKMANSLLESRKAHATTLIDQAIVDGKVEEHERASLANSFVADFAVAKKALEERKATTLKNNPIDISGSRQAVENSKLQATQMREKVANAAHAEMKESGCNYDQAFARVKLKPEFKEHFSEEK